MIEDNLIMSRFESKVNKCNTPADLEKLCETYLKFRGKDVNIQLMPQPQTVNKLIYVGPDANNFRRFAFEEIINDYEMNTLCAGNRNLKKMDINRKLVDDIIHNMIQEDYVKFSQYQNVASCQTIFRAEVGAIKL